MNSALMVFFSALFFSLTAVAAMPSEVGQTAFVRGKVLALHPDFEQRPLVQSNQGIFLKDRIDTSDRSFSVLDLLDRAKISVRPLSQFSVETYLLNERKAEFRLEQGGVEVQMGKIGTDSPDALVVKTAMAEVSAQQGHFRLRLCGKDCAQEEQNKAKRPVPLERDVVARVAQLRGEVIAKSTGAGTPGQADSRRLALGAPLYRQDQVTSGEDARAMLLFRDGGRVGLGANSAMEIQNYRWQEPGFEDHFALRLLRGGLRSMTGALGKTKPEAISIDTPISLVGIRGTVFDLLLPAPKSEEPPLLYSYVHEGEIELKTGTSEVTLLRKDEGNRQEGDQAEPIDALPGDESLIGSDPRQVQVDLKADFGQQSTSGVPEGLYVYAVDGHIRIRSLQGPWKGRLMHLGRGEAAYVDDQGILWRLDRPKAFQLWDLPEEDAGTPLPAAMTTTPPAPPTPPAAPPAPPGVQKLPPRPPVAPMPVQPPVKKITRGCPPGSVWNKSRKSCVSKQTSGCPSGTFYSKRARRCLPRQTRAPAPKPRGCPAGTYYSKRHNGCVREQKQHSGASTAAKAAVGAAIAIGIIRAIGGGRGGGHSKGH